MVRTVALLMSVPVGYSRGAPNDAAPAASNLLAMITSFLRDLRYALRTLGRNPGFACISVLALALGIGANSAIFTVVNSVLLQPLRFQKPEQLVVVRERNLKAGFPQFSLSPGNYLGYRDQNHTFSGIAAFGGAGRAALRAAAVCPHRGSRRPLCARRYWASGGAVALGDSIGPL